MKNTITMHHSILIVSLIILIGIYTGCDAVIGSVGELPEDIENCESNEALCPSNTNDPKSTDFSLPSIQLTNGISLDTPFTLESNNVTLSWQVVDENGSPIDFEYSYQFAYAEPNKTIGAGDFQDLGTSNSISLNNLKETFNNELYSFEIQASYTSDDISKDTTFTGQFSVDAIQGRGFLFNPVQLERNTDGTYTADIYLDNIQESDDLTAFTLAVNYSTLSFDVSENDIDIYDDANGFLGRDNAEIIVFTEFTNNLILIHLGMAGNNLSPLSGGGAVCQITLTPTSAFNGQATFSISTTSSKLKNSMNTDIPIEASSQATILQ